MGVLNHSGVLECDLNARLEQQSLVVMMIMMFIEVRQKAHMEDIYSNLLRPGDTSSWRG